MALIQAVADGNLQAVKALLAAGAKPDVQVMNGYTALMWAASKGNLELVKILLAHQADPNAVADGNITVLMLATLSGNADVVKLLLGTHVDYDAQRNDGFTALAIAANAGHIEIVQVLIDVGAALSENGYEVQQATNHDNRAMLEALLRAGANANDALWLAASKGQLEMVQVLLADANLNNQRPGGWTALMFAADNGHCDVVKVLLAADSARELENDDGNTAETIATKRGHHEIAKLIRDWPAKTG